MPSNKRQGIKQTLDGVKSRSETNKEILVNLANVYLEHHPDYAQIMFRLAKHFDDALLPIQSLIDII